MGSTEAIEVVFDGQSALERAAEIPATAVASVLKSLEKSTEETELEAAARKLAAEFADRVWWRWLEAFHESRGHPVFAWAFLLGVDDPQFASVTLKGDEYDGLWAHWKEFLNRKNATSADHLRAVSLFVGARRFDEAQKVVDACFARSGNQLDLDCLEAKALVLLKIDAGQTVFEDVEKGVQVVDKILNLTGPGPRNARIRMMKAASLIQPEDASLGQAEEAENLIKDHLQLLQGSHQARGMAIVAIARLKNRYIEDAAQAMRIAASLFPPGHPSRHMSFYLALEIATGRFSLVNETTLDLAQEWVVSAREAFERKLADKKHVWMALHHLARHALASENRRDLAIAAAHECLTYCEARLEFAKCLRLSGIARSLDPSEEVSELAQAAKDFLAVRVAFSEASPPNGGPESLGYAKACSEAARALTHPKIRNPPNDKEALRLLQEALKVYKLKVPDEKEIIESVETRIREIETRMSSESY